MLCVVDSGSTCAYSAMLCCCQEKFPSNSPHDCQSPKELSQSPFFIPPTATNPFLTSWSCQPPAPHSKFPYWLTMRLSPTNQIASFYTALTDICIQDIQQCPNSFTLKMAKTSSIQPKPKSQSCTLYYFSVRTQ
jgi:hypothetical protein